MKYRKLRIAFSGVCGVLCLLLIVMWVRSYAWMDLAYFQIFHTPTVAGISASGRVMLGFEHAGSSGSTFNVISRSLRQYPPDALISGLTPSGFNVVALSGGWRLDLPYYFVLTLVIVIAATPWRRWRFSLRTLLIATTVIAVVLGATVYVAN